MNYATAADLEAFIGEPPIAGAERLLQRASEMVDSALLNARYDVDASGNPTDATLLSFLMKATCAQVEWWAVQNDEFGGLAAFEEVQLGPARLRRSAGSSSTPQEPDLCARSKMYLRQAGVWPGKAILR